MKIIRSFGLSFLILAFLLPAWQEILAAPQARPGTALRDITIDDYFRIRDVGQPELSPDGQWVAYTVRTKMLKEDKNEMRIWMVSPPSRFNSHTWVLPPSREDVNARYFPSGLQRGCPEETPSAVIGSASPPCVETIQMRVSFLSSLSILVRTV